MNSGSFSNSLTGIFKDISLVHEEAKTIYLHVEALCLDGDLFFQPMKEQRDAEEHLVRALGKMANGGYFEYASKAAGIDDEAESYVIGNLEKAFNHEQRALVDASEWLLLVVKTMLPKFMIITLPTHPTVVFPGK